MNEKRSPNYQLGSVSFNFKCHENSPLALLLEFVRGDCLARASRGKFVRLNWREKAMLALESFWLPSALRGARENESMLFDAVNGCIYQLERHRVLLGDHFSLGNIDEQTEQSKWVSSTLLDDSLQGGKIISIRYRFQPHVGSKAELVLTWVRDPDNPVMFSMAERVCLALEAFWMPFALRHFQRAPGEINAAARRCILQLLRRIQELRGDYYGENVSPRSTPDAAFSQSKNELTDDELLEPSYDSSEADLEDGADEALTSWGR